MRMSLLFMAGCMLAAGCSTPQVALDHANNGVALTTGLQRELLAHEKRQAAFDEVRRKVIVTETISAHQYLQDNTLNDRLLQLSGQTEELEAYKQIRDLADLRAKVIKDKTADGKAVQDALDALMKPLPDVHGGVGGTQKTLADLGTELSNAERLKLVTTFLQEVRTEIEKNRQAADSKTPTSTN